MAIYGARFMKIKFNCYNCKQTIEVDTISGGQTFPCPSCSSELTVPEISPLTIPPPIPSMVQAPKQRSIGWGVFKGLFGFFVVLPLTIIIFLAVVGIVMFSINRSKTVRAVSVTPNATVAAATVTNKVDKINRETMLKAISASPLYKVTKDEMRNLVFIKPAHSTEHETGCYLYVADDGDGKPGLFFRCLYVGSDSFHFDEALFRVNETLYTIKHPSFQLMKSYRDGDRNFVGSQDFYISRSEREAISNLVSAASEPVTVRLSSTTYNNYFDFKLPLSQIKEMAYIRNVWLDLMGTPVK
jgi:hypothetical protein